MSHPGGRPTKYDPSFVDAVDAYLGTTSKDQMKLPTMQGLSLHLNVNGDTLVQWAKDHEEFSAAIDKLKATQATQLINDGIYGGKEVNAPIVKLMLMNNHGMRERSDLTSDDEPIRTVDVGELLSRVYGPNPDTTTDEVPSDS